MKVRIISTVFDPTIDLTNLAYRIGKLKNATNDWDRLDKYKVWIGLTGYDLVNVQKVRYTLPYNLYPKGNVISLDRTFINRTLTAEFWTHSDFDVKIDIIDIEGRSITLYHFLNIIEQLRFTPHTVKEVYDGWKKNK